MLQFFKMNLSHLLVVILLVSLISARDDPKKWNKMEQPQSEMLYTQKQYEFNQIVDHFNYQNTSYFKQRYWVIDEYFNPKVGPVFLFICGQYICNGVPQARQWVVTMAQRMFGLILVLQHRYYGKSMPFGNKSLQLQNMVFLNSQQALKDLAYFLNEMNKNNMYKINKNPWIAMGGSYPGALSAWFRYKYPHLTIGAIASSAVILAVQNFTDFDEQIFISSNKSGAYCYNAINNSNARVQEILLSENSTNFKMKFQGGQNLSNEQFMFFWIDSFVDKIQYGSRTTFCNDLKNKNADEQFDYLINLANTTNSVFQYGSYYLKNVTFAVQNGQGSRAWLYQSCTQFGYWQTFSPLHPMRSKWLNLDFYKKLCANSFGQGTWPKIARKNIEYGGLNEKSFNLLMNNGVEDPWRWASLQKSQGNIIARVADCQNCAHCVQLYSISKNDSAALKKIRDEQYLTLQDWIQTYWRNLKAVNMPKLQKIKKILQID